MGYHFLFWPLHLWGRSVQVALLGVPNQKWLWVVTGDQSHRQPLPAWTRIPGSQKESRCLAQIVLFTQLRHSQPLLSVKVVGTLPKIQVPRLHANLEIAAFQRIPVKPARFSFFPQSTIFISSAINHVCILLIFFF